MTTFGESLEGAGFFWNKWGFGSGEYVGYEIICIEGFIMGGGYNFPCCIM